MRRSTRGIFKISAVLALVGGLAAASCAKRDPAGITLALATDVLVPDDIDAVEAALTDGIALLEADPSRTQSMTGFRWITSISLNAT